MSPTVAQSLWLCACNVCDSASPLLLSPPYLYQTTSHGLFALRSPSAFSLAGHPTLRLVGGFDESAWAGAGAGACAALVVGTRILAELVHATRCEPRVKQRVARFALPCLQKSRQGRWKGWRPDRMMDQ
jgi:hypothetical protein